MLSVASSWMLQTQSDGEPHEAIARRRRGLPSFGHTFKNLANALLERMRRGVPPALGRWLVSVTHQTKPSRISTSDGSTHRGPSGFQSDANG
jgi:hypothetical protein